VVSLQTPARPQGMGVTNAPSCYTWQELPIAG
jgi:hypothetical protein